MGEIWILTLTAISIAFVHTIIGPDHYLPFIVMSKARNWSLFKTIRVTFFCGIGHVMSSVVIGIIGIVAGIALNKLEFFEEYRGNIAAWAIILFGLGYTIYGIIKATNQHTHTHVHINEDGSYEKHKHSHSHTQSETHKHKDSGSQKANITPWILFTIFLLGPCEPLIPLLMFPAAELSVIGIVIVAGAFSIVTIATMIAIVFLAYRGISFIKTNILEKYIHALAGVMILLSGLAIVFLGL
ncbi:MAG: hypothetical protein GX793_10660 [Bacteroidales bacterium]|jgi:ABC-type nickel/cobalt efflux system permease component RcnA|nr:sulfite exporter TauE/SafE family protein [Bacteroidales bacterium]MCK9498177.1 sulfite exporter TauE/SafE family protein [Bacteroidales bacterium]MDY0313496.1 sulfite exporter TauE/SafE family protein [Bacteroidales bacterium]NLB87508.1 hypothetical protein [Bacteroidales bacterium]